MKFRTFYGVRGEAPTGLTCDDESRTRQEFLKESLTSTIMERFAATGVLTPTVNQARIAQFGDFTQVPSDLLEASSRLDNVQDIFDGLPSKIRAEFGNNALAFVQFMANPANKSKAIELGLIEKPIESPKKQAAEAAKPVSPSKAATAADSGSDNSETTVNKE